MVVMENPIPGAIVSVPVGYFRCSFNKRHIGIEYSAGVIKEIDRNEQGFLIVKVEYPPKGYKQKRYYHDGTEMPPITATEEKWFAASEVFEYATLLTDRKWLRFPRECWAIGSYNENVEFLIDKGKVDLLKTDEM